TATASTATGGRVIDRVGVLVNEVPREAAAEPPHQLEPEIVRDRVAARSHVVEVGWAARTRRRESRGRRVRNELLLLVRAFSAGIGHRGNQRSRQVLLHRRLP